MEGKQAAKPSTRTQDDGRDLDFPPSGLTHLQSVSFIHRLKPRCSVSKRTCSVLPPEDEPALLGYLETDKTCIYPLDFS